MKAKKIGCSVARHIAGLKTNGRLCVVVGLTAALLCVLVAAPTVAQTTFPLPPNAQKVPTSLPHIYWHFLLYQNHLDQLALRREQQGKDGTALRNHFQQKLGFSNAQFAVVRTAAQRLQSELSSLDSQAQAIINAARAANPLQPGVPYIAGPVPPELKTLQQQHEDVIQSEVTNLKSSLGPDLAARLDAFLQTRAAPNGRAKVHYPTADELRQHMMQAAQKDKGGQQ